MRNHTNFLGSFKWAQTWIPKIAPILGRYAFRESTFEEDTKEATDLIVLRAEGLRVACRVRKPGYVEKYAGEITITTRRETGSPCEWDKLDRADWLFYAHATKENITDEGARLWPYTIIDVKKALPKLRELKNRLPEQPNRDALGKRCFFTAFRVAALDPGCFIYKPILGIVPAKPMAVNGGGMLQIARKELPEPPRNAVQEMLNFPTEKMQLA